MSISGLQRSQWSEPLLEYFQPVYDRVQTDSPPETKEFAVKLPKRENDHCILLQFSDGEYYGEAKDNRPHGQGTCVYNDRRKYQGEWVEGEKTKGTLFLPDGSKYIGEFKDDTFNGDGTYRSTDGSVYIGHFKDGKRNGQGVQVFANGEQMSGEWIDDQLKLGWSCSSRIPPKKDERYQCVIC